MWLNEKQGQLTTLPFSPEGDGPQNFSTAIFLGKKILNFEACEPSEHTIPELVIG
jgi:hypothetical protein